MKDFYYSFVFAKFLGETLWCGNDIFTWILPKHPPYNEFSRILALILEFHIQWGWYWDQQFVFISKQYSGVSKPASLGLNSEKHCSKLCYYKNGPYPHMTRNWLLQIEMCWECNIHMHCASKHATFHVH
jgi:hypothetical protein